MNALEQKDYQALIHSARIVVRDIGHVARLAEDEFRNSTALCTATLHHHINHAYDMACWHLTQLDPTGAAEFIRSTYGPSFRQTEVTKMTLKHEPNPHITDVDTIKPNSHPPSAAKWSSSMKK